MPEIGEIKTRRELGRKGDTWPGLKFVWHACVECGKERWVAMRGGQPKHLRCSKCDGKGERHWRWQGGRRMFQGYVLVYCPGHPRARSDRYVLEHIVVWEQAHGQSLPEGWEVRHLNAIKDDNRPENLVAMPKAGHTRIELGELYKKRIRQLEAQLDELRPQKLL